LILLGNRGKFNAGTDRKMQKRRAAEFLTTLDAGKYLGRSIRTLATWRQNGYGPAFHRIGGAVRYSLEDLDEFLNSSRFKPKSGCRFPKNGRKEELTPA
jgi:hypothetical protein